jgi:hypothetical protein
VLGVEVEGVDLYAVEGEEDEVVVGGEVLLEAVEVRGEVVLFSRENHLNMQSSGHRLLNGL